MGINGSLEEDYFRQFCESCARKDNCRTAEALENGSYVSFVDDAITHGRTLDSLCNYTPIGKPEIPAER